MAAFPSTGLQVLWVATAGVLLIVVVLIGVAASRSESRGLMVGCVLGAAILLVSGVFVFRGFTVPMVPFGRVQLILMDIGVMVAAIIVGSIVAVLVMKGGSRRFVP